MKQRYDSIIFDMDGVLVNNSSYCTAIQKTVEFSLWNRFRLKKKIPMKYIETIKGITGFNNDWDTSYALIRLLGDGVRVERFREEVEQITPQVRKSAAYRKVKDIFQAFYLGKTLFRQIYEYEPPLKMDEGLISLETLLIDPMILKRLASNYLLGIATSRPRFEALYAVNNLKLSPDYIKIEFLIAKEDVKNEKPEPDPLLEVQRRMKVKWPIYIGDTINDVVAAKKANMPCIFVGSQKLGDFQIKKTNQLMEVLYE